MLIIIYNVREYKSSPGTSPTHRLRSTGAGLKDWLGWCDRWQGSGRGWRNWSARNGKRQKGKGGWKEESSSRKPPAGRSCHHNFSKSEASRTEQRTWDCPYLTWIIRVSSEQEEIPGLLYWNNLHPLTLRIFIRKEVRELQRKCLNIIIWAREIFFSISNYLLLLCRNSINF